MLRQQAEMEDAVMSSEYLRTSREIAVVPFGRDQSEVTVIEEVPVGVIYGGIPHAVMMTTPADLEDFALGFSLTEGIIKSASDVRHMIVKESCDGIEISVDLVPDRLHGFLSRRRMRNLRGNTSCGLCGVEDIADARCEMPGAAVGRGFSRGAIKRALDALPVHQHLHRRTRAAHAAAWVSIDGDIRLVREDVGRHNALDKLIGAALHQQEDLSDGFCLITSRCSYEMVQKALMAAMPAIVAISAPTALAVRTAKNAGLTLVASARFDGHNVYAGHERICADEVSSV